LSGTYLYIESTGFTQSVNTYFGNDEAYAGFQAELAEHPDRGSVIPGASPLRKLRWQHGRRGMGKRGGLRVIYIHLPDLSVVFLLDVYGKDEADDLTNEEKRGLQGLARQLVTELGERKRRGKL
jgi:hypothetical protein